jgi:hypothetical protein
MIVTPSPADDAAMLAVIGDDKAVAELSDSSRRKLLDDFFNYREEFVYRRSSERFRDRARRIRARNAIVSGLGRTLKALDDGAVAFDAVGWLTDHYRDDLGRGIKRLRTLQNLARRLLDGARPFEPEPSRSARGEEQFRTVLQGQAVFLLLELLESVGVIVRASLGPRTRLLARMLAYVTNEKELDVHTVKNLVAEARGDRTKSGKDLSLL